MATLLTPGPVPVPPWVQAAMQQPVIHHRTPEFEAFYQSFLGDLRYVFQTSGAVAASLGSGTFGVEMAMYSLFQKGDKIAVLDMGKFSGRWADYGEVLGCEVIRLQKPWGETWQVDELMEKLKPHGQLKGIVVTHSETSTGTIVDLEAIASKLRVAYPEILIVVDAITSVGAMPYYHEAWGIDCTVTASQKALMNPAGLVLFAVSENGRQAMRPNDPGDFQHVENYLTSAEKYSFPFTAPVIPLYGIAAALAYIKKETLPVIWQACHQSAQVFRRGVEEIGGEVFSQYPTDSLTAFKMKDGDIHALKSILEVRYGWKLSGGQGELKGKILRISHMAEAHEGIMQQVLADLKLSQARLRA
ncbi:MAG: aminotransferase class V-fold PLP-dependent enzyme [Bacteroidota bacterium]